MKHISELFSVIKGYVSRDQILKDKTKQYLQEKLSIELQDNQIKVGKTIIMLTHLHFVEREQLAVCNIGEMIEFINKNEYNFSVQDVMIK